MHFVGMPIGIMIGMARGFPQRRGKERDGIKGKGR
jgi:hypothetical protein